jgi:uncharacterized BrkB/YihY/UPF0761 family membrane protein
LSLLRRLVRWLDRAQRRHRALAVAFAVNKKYGDDSAGNLASVLAFSGFVTLFPLLLLFVTVLGLVLSGDPRLRGEILRSSFSQFPLMGSELRTNIHVLKRGSLIGLIVAIVALFCGSFALAGNGIYAMEQIWNIPGLERIDFLRRTGRSAQFICCLGAGLVVSTLLSGFATNTASRPFLADAGAIALCLVVSCAQFVVAYRVLTPAVVGTRSLVTGAIAAGLGWTALQGTGTYLVGHQLNSSSVYGVFAFVLGLVFWISLVTRLVAYTCELNVVLSRHLWPRALVQPPLTRADREVLAAQAEQNRRRREQHVRVSFEELAGAHDIARVLRPSQVSVNGGSSGALSSVPGEKRPRSPSPG